MASSNSVETWYCNLRPSGDGPCTILTLDGKGENYCTHGCEVGAWCFGTTGSGEQVLVDNSSKDISSATCRCGPECLGKQGGTCACQTALNLRAAEIEAASRDEKLSTTTSSSLIAGECS